MLSWCHKQQQRSDKGTQLGSALSAFALINGTFCLCTSSIGKGFHYPQLTGGEGIEAGEGVRARKDEDKAVEWLVASITDAIEMNVNPMKEDG